MKKGKKQHFFENLSHFMFTKGFEVVFSVNGILIDVKNVHEHLKIKIFVKTSLFCVKVWLFQKSVFCRLKKVQN